MQHNDQSEARNEDKARQIEDSLVSTNPTVERVLEACRRIQRQWTATPAQQPVEHDEWQSA